MGEIARNRVDTKGWRMALVFFYCIVTPYACAPSESATPMLSSTSRLSSPNRVAVYPLKLSPNNRYLVDENNQPFFLSGDTAWSLIVEGTDAEIDYYLADRQQKGFNAVLINLLEHKFASHAPKNINGDAPFTGPNFITPNEAYFAHADYAINAAASHGTVVLLDPLYVGYGCGDEGWCAEIKAASTADLQAWGQYVANRYKKFDNLIWIIGGDVDPATAGVSSKVHAFATSLKAADPRHLVSAHNARGEMAVDPWPTASWLTLNNTYTSFEGTAAGARTAYNHSPALPFFQIEGHYENEHGMTQTATAGPGLLDRAGRRHGLCVWQLPGVGLGSAGRWFLQGRQLGLEGAAGQPELAPLQKPAAGRPKPPGQLPERMTHAPSRRRSSRPGPAVTVGHTVLVFVVVFDLEKR